MKRIAVLPGDGIGPEVVSATVYAIQSLTDQIEFVNGAIGLDCYNTNGTYLPKSTLDLIDTCDAIVVGCITDNKDDRNYRNPVAELKKHLKLYAIVTPIKRLNKSMGFTDVNMTVISDSYHYTSELKDVEGVTLEQHIDSASCLRLCQFARRYAEWANMKNVVCVHERDMFPDYDGVLVSAFAESMAGSNFDTRYMKMREATAEIVTSPENIDMAVTLNLYGDILVEEASALIGGAYLSCSGSIGDHMGLFEPGHSSNPSLAGTNSVNPTASILSGAMMLEFVGMQDEANKLRDAVSRAYKRGYRTKDVGGELGTYEFAQKIAELCVNPL